MFRWAYVFSAARFCSAYIDLLGEVVLLLEEVDGKGGVLARSSAHAEVLVAGLDHLERCPVIPQRVLEEQGAKRLQLALQLWLGVGQTVHFETVHGLVEVQVLLVVQNDAFALERARRAARFATVAREAESAADSLLGNGVAGLESLDGLRGGRGLHGWLRAWMVVFGFSLRKQVFQFLFCEHCLFAIVCSFYKFLLDERRNP